MVAATAASEPFTETRALLDAASEEEALPAPVPDWTREGAWKLDAELPPRLRDFTVLIEAAFAGALPVVPDGKVSVHRAHPDDVGQIVGGTTPMQLTKPGGGVWMVVDANRMVLTKARDYVLLWHSEARTERVRQGAWECLEFLAAAAQEWGRELGRAA